MAPREARWQCPRSIATEDCPYFDPVAGPLIAMEEVGRRHKAAILLSPSRSSTYSERSKTLRVSHNHSSTSVWLIFVW